MRLIPESLTGYVDIDGKASFSPGVGLMADLYQFDGLSIYVPPKVSKNLIAEIVAAKPYLVEELLAKHKDAVAAAAELDRVEVS